jgi:hypothetical protein
MRTLLVVYELGLSSLSTVLGTIADDMIGDGKVIWKRTLECQCGIHARANQNIRDAAMD